MMDTVSDTINRVGGKVLLLLGLLYFLCGIGSVAATGYSAEQGMAWQTSVFFGLSEAVSCLVAVGLLYNRRGRLAEPDIPDGPSSC